MAVLVELTRRRQATPPGNGPDTTERRGIGMAWNGQGCCAWLRPGLLPLTAASDPSVRGVGRSGRSPAELTLLYQHC